MINLFLMLLVLFFIAVVYVAVMEVVHKVRVERRTRQFMDRFNDRPHMD